MSKREELRSKFYVFANDAISEIEYSEQYPGKYRSDVTFDGSSTRTESVLFPDYSRIFAENWEDIKALDSFVECIEYGFSEFEVIQQYHSYGDAFEKILRRFLRVLLRRSSLDLGFTDPDFDEVYSDFERDLLSKTITMRRIFPLQGLGGEFSTIELSDSTRIRKIEEEDIEFLNGESRGAESVLKTPIEWSSAMYLFEIELEAEKAEETVWDIKDRKRITERFNQITENIITALRLTSVGEVGYSEWIDHYDAAWYIRRVSRQENRIRIQRIGHSGMDLGSNTEELIRKYRVLEEKDMDSLDVDLTLAIERYNSSFLRERDSVAFSDLIIILEALLTKSKNVSGTELAQRAAILLGENHQERQKLFEDVQELYNQRGRVWGVAHGGGSTDLDSEILDQAREIARQSLWIILKMERDYGGHGNIMKRMNEEINQSMLDVEFP